MSDLTFRRNRDMIPLTTNRVTGDFYFQPTHNLFIYIYCGHRTHALAQRLTIKVAVARLVAWLGVGSMLFKSPPPTKEKSRRSLATAGFMEPIDNRLSVRR